MNRYDIKVYTKSGVYTTTINPNLIMNDISFTENVNGGQGQLTLSLALDFGDTTFSGGEIVKVDLYNERHKQGKQIYMGYVSQVSRMFDTNKGYIQLTCLGIGSLLTKILYTGSRSGTATQLITSIVNTFNASYPGSLITIGTLDEYSGTLSYTFSKNNNCQQALNEIAKSCNYYRYINGEGVLSFREKRTQTKHILANRQVVESMKINYNIESMINKLYVERKDGTTITYQSTNSQNIYGIKEKYENKSDIENLATQNEYGNNTIAQYANPKNATTIVVNNEYDIESITPGDIITVVNTEYTIEDLLIEKISYTPSRATLTLEENETLRDVISN